MLAGMGEHINPKQYSPLTLAHIGDGVFELCARETVLHRMGECPVHKLHRATVELVRASAQSEGFSKIQERLTEEELSIFKRGRNASSNTTPKGATEAEYHRATGVECLFGYLYLKGEYERIWKLFEKMYEEENHGKQTARA